MFLVGGVIAPQVSSGLCLGPRMPRPPAGSSLCWSQEEVHSLGWCLQRTKAAGLLGRIGSGEMRQRGLVGEFCWEKYGCRLVSLWTLQSKSVKRLEECLSPPGGRRVRACLPLSSSSIHPGWGPLSRGASCLWTVEVPEEAVGWGKPAGACGTGLLLACMCPCIAPGQLGCRG